MIDPAFIGGRGSYAINITYICAFPFHQEGDNKKVICTNSKHPAKKKKTSSLNWKEICRVIMRALIMLDVPIANLSSIYHLCSITFRFFVFLMSVVPTVSSVDSREEPLREWRSTVPTFRLRSVRAR